MRKSCHFGSTFIFALLETCFILLGMLLLYLFLPRALHGDGTHRYTYLIDLLHHGIVPSPTARYSLIGPLFALPLLIIGNKLHQPVDWILVYNYILFAASLLATYWLCKDRVDRGFLRKFILLIITSSMFAAHLFSFYGEVFSAVCVGLGIIAILIRKTSIAGWIAIILGVMNTPAMMVGLGLVVLKRMLNKKRFRYVIVLVITGCLILGEAWIRRGSPLTSGYRDDKGFRTIMPYLGLPGFSYPFLFGLLAILFSFGKGLIFFAPGLLLPVRKTIQKWQTKYSLDLYQIYVLWLCFLVGLILAYSKWWSWYGGVYWGPRFFLFASLPASFALAVRLQDKETHLVTNVFTLLVLCLSAWVGLCAAIFQSDTYINTCLQNNYALEAFCHYVPEFSVLWRPFVVHPHLTSHQIIYLVYALLVFGYFLLPLLGKFFQQTRTLLNPYARDYLKIQNWRI
jgi:hypothetical protein